MGALMVLGYTSVLYHNVTVCVFDITSVLVGALEPPVDSLLMYSFQSTT